MTVKPPNEPENPSEALGLCDRGDDTQRRFRYQINYSCLKALQLLRDEQPLLRIFCEQIEDLMLERQDGKFLGVQIKTRGLDQPPFKASDDAIVNALCRFCERDAKFDGAFAQFTIATNFVFYDADSPENLRKVLEYVRSNPALDGLGPRHKIRKYIDNLCAATGLPKASVIATLSKVTLEPRKTGIDQPDIEFVPALGELPQFNNMSIDKLQHGARLLRSAVWNATSLTLEGVVLDSHEVSSDFERHLEKLRLAKKRFSREDVATLLEPIASAETNAELLSIAGYLARGEGPFPGLTRLELKMAAGAISYHVIEQMKDNVASLETAFLRWNERFGLREANKRLAHVQHFALRDARIEIANHEAPDSPYGAAALKGLTLRTQQTIDAERGSLFGCRAEHLLGAAGLVSQECKLWWSKPVVIEDGHGDHS